MGRSHGFDGSFWVEGASHPLQLGTVVVLDGSTMEVERRGGTDARPLVRLSGLPDPVRLRGASLLVDQELGPGEWLASDLVGCEVAGLGTVGRVLVGPSCDVLELEDGTLVPLVSDAVSEVDLSARLIRVDRGFLGLEGAS